MVIVQGMRFQHKFRKLILQITAAASLWATSAINLLIGVDDYILALFAVLPVFIILPFEHIIRR